MYTYDDLGKFFWIPECLETQSVKDNFASLGCFDPGGRHQQVEVLRKVGPPYVAIPITVSIPYPSHTSSLVFLSLL